LNLWIAFAFGILGGIAGEVLNLEVHRRTVREKWPKYLRQRRYWSLGLLYVFFGGVLPFMHTFDGSKLTAWASFNLGLTAPLVLKGAFRAAPAGPPGTVDTIPGSAMDLASAPEANPSPQEMPQVISPTPEPDATIA
jgi:hypothetical protein